MRAQLAFYTASILAPALLCMSLLVLANVNASRLSHEQQLLATARAVSASVDQRLTRAIALNEVFATEDTIRREDWNGARTRVTRLQDPATWVMVTDTQGWQKLNTNPEARQTAPANPLPANMRLALSSSRSQVSNVFFGPAAHRYLVAIDTPVDAGARPYVVSQLMGPEQFLPVFAKARIPQGAFITMVDRDQRVVARSRFQQRFVGAEATEDMKRAMQDRAEGIATSHSLEGEASIVAFTRSPLSGWTTMVVVPRQAFETPMWSNLLGLGAVILLAAAGATLGAALFLRTIARELGQLEQDAVAVGHGHKVDQRPGLISNFGQVQAALAEASRELRVRADRQNLMINELNHRVKNTLATVQSLAMQTFRDGGPDARSKFDRRLASLADGHDLLTKKNWEQVGLAEVVDRCLGTHGDRIEASGPAVTLQPSAALALCMCLHELMTNSSKYGALSNETGRVEVTWTLCPQDARLRLVWRESGGPRVEPPGAGGFGTRLVDRLMRHELAGQVERRFEPEGLIFTADIGLAAVSRWRNDFSDKSAEPAS